MDNFKLTLLIGTLMLSPVAQSHDPVSDRLDALEADMVNHTHIVPEPDLQPILDRLDAVESTIFDIETLLSTHTHGAPDPDPTPDPDPVPNPGGDPYDLGPLPANLQDIEWPVAPVTTNTVQVSTDGDWTDADDTLYVVAAGTYSSKTITCSNCEFQLDDNAVINGSLTFDGSAIKWDGGQKIGAGNVGLGGNASGDILIANFHGVSTGNHNSFSGNFDWNRVALVNTTLELVGGDSSGGWALYIQQPWPAGVRPFTGSNLILANVKLLSNAQNNRFQSINNLVIVDSSFNSDGNSSNGYRFQHGVQDLYVRDTVMVGVSSGQGVPRVSTGRFENVTRYVSDPASAFFGVGVDVVDMTINNSQVYTVNNAGNPPPLFDATGTNPVTLAWDGVTLPDHSGYGADH